MPSIYERERATPMGKRFEVRWRGPDLNNKGHLKDHMKPFATVTEAEEFRDALPPMRQVPARCGCPEPRWILIDVNVLALGEITCSICGTPFTTIEPEN